MSVRREPPEGGMTTKRYGQQFARNVLLRRLDVSEGDTVEVDYRAKSGLEVSKVGTVADVNTGQKRGDTWIDVTIRTGGPTDTCYLHVNTVTRDVFFTNDSRKCGDRTLLQFRTY